MCIQCLEEDRSNFRALSNDCIQYILHHTVVLQPFGNVDSLDICRLLEWPHIQDELVSDKTCSEQDKNVLKIKLIQTN